MRSSQRLQETVQHPDEPTEKFTLSELFQKALALQNEGTYDEALETYELILKVTKQFDVDISRLAFIHINMGAIFLAQSKLDQAREQFEIALEYREIGSIHVNLATLRFGLACETMSLEDRRAHLIKASGHCRQAIQLNDDVSAVRTANRLSVDIDKMLKESGGLIR